MGEDGRIPLPDDITDPDRTHALLTTSLREDIQRFSDMDGAERRRFRQRVRNRLYNTLLDFGLLYSYAPDSLTSHVFEKVDKNHSGFDESLSLSLVGLFAVIFRSMKGVHKQFFSHLERGIETSFAEAGIRGFLPEFIADFEFELGGSVESYDYDQLHEWYEKEILEDKLSEYDQTVYARALLELYEQGYEITEIENIAKKDNN